MQRTISLIVTATSLILAGCGREDQPEDRPEAESPSSDSQAARVEADELKLQEIKDELEVLKVEMERETKSLERALEQGFSVNSEIVRRHMEKLRELGDRNMEAKTRLQLIQDRLKKAGT